MIIDIDELNKSINLATDATYEDSNSNKTNFSLHDLCDSLNISNTRKKIRQCVLSEIDIHVLEEVIDKENHIFANKKLQNKNFNSIKKGINTIDNNIESYLDLPFFSQKNNLSKLKNINLAKNLKANSNNYKEEKDIFTKSFEEDNNINNDD